MFFWIMGKVPTDEYGAKVLGDEIRLKVAEEPAKRSENVGYGIRSKRLTWPERFFVSNHGLVFSYDDAPRY